MVILRTLVVTKPMILIENIAQQDCETIRHDTNEMMVLPERTVTMMMMIVMEVAVVVLNKILMRIKMDWD